MNTRAFKSQNNPARAAANRFADPSRAGSSVARLAGGRSQMAVQLKMQATIQQKGNLEEELLQGKFETLQRMGKPEEEELLQGKFETLQRMGKPEEEELLQGKFETLQRMGKPEEELLQGKFDPIQRKPNKTGLPDNLKSGIENLSGLAMDDVQVHYNSNKPSQLQAHAYAQGTDIHIAPGQEQHVSHEAWHVVQQKQGRVQPTMKLKGQSINDDTGLEREADVMGAKAGSTFG